jgi:hypothetical protein
MVRLNQLAPLYRRLSALLPLRFLQHPWGRSGRQRLWFRWNL